MIDAAKILEILLRGPAITQVFIAVFLLYLAWAVSHHLWIGFWLALLAAVLFQFWVSRGTFSLSSLIVPAVADLPGDPTAAPAPAAPASKFPELLLRYATSMLVPRV